MGTSISKQQLEILASAGPEVIVCFDGDEAGATAAAQVAAQIAGTDLWVTIRGCPSGEKPHQHDIEDFLPTVPRGLKRHPSAGLHWPAVRIALQILLELACVLYSSNRFWITAFLNEIQRVRNDCVK